MPSSPYVSRINQIDAAQLDDEIYKVLRNEMKEIATHCMPGKFDKWQAEIDVFLKFLIWRFSLRGGSSTLGQRLLNLRYANINQRKAILYLLLSVVPQYLKEKVQDNENLSGHGIIDRTAKTFTDKISNFVSMLEFVNVLLFLHRGVQPRVIELLLGLSSQSITTHRPRNIGYSYMTRELLWHGLMELFTVGIPMINYHYLKHTLVRLLRRARQPAVVSLPVLDVDTKCAYCEQTPILPSHAGCKHIFCYYCMQAHFTAMNTFLCPVCNTELYVKKMKRYVPESCMNQLSK